MRIWRQPYTPEISKILSRTKKFKDFKDSQKKTHQGLDDAITDIHKVGQWAWGTGRMFHVVHIGEMSEANCKDYLYYSVMTL